MTHSIQKYKTTNNISVDLLNKSYLIACPPESEPDLQAAVMLLNQKMTEAQQLGHDYSNEQAAIIAALNLAYDFNLTQKAIQIQEPCHMLSPNPAFDSKSELYAFHDDAQDDFELDPENEFDIEKNDPYDANLEEDEELEVDDEEEEEDNEDDDDYDDYLDEDDPDFDDTENE